MKKLILTLTVILSALSASAQHYRGFFDFMTTFPISNSNGTTFDDASGISIGCTTSHGVQFKNLFVGVGTGAMFIPSSYNVGLPVFAEARWDFFRGRTINFFVGCKIGGIFNISDDKYGINVDGEKNYYYFESDNSYSDYSWYGDAGYGNLYFQPSVGMRFRLNNTMGINLTLSYLPMKFNKETTFHGYTRQITGNDSWGDPIYSHEYNDWTEYSKFWSHRIALSVGIDF